MKITLQTHKLKEMLHETLINIQKLHHESLAVGSGMITMSRGNRFPFMPKTKKLPSDFNFKMSLYSKIYNEMLDLYVSICAHETDYIEIEYKLYNKIVAWHTGLLDIKYAIDFCVKQIAKYFFSFDYPSIDELYKYIDTKADLFNPNMEFTKS